VSQDPTEITRLLNRAAQGDATAGREVFPAIYRELRRIASSKLSRLPAGATLQTTVLVHEAYLRIVPRNPEGWESIGHFYFTAARAMRDILVEEARRRLSRKRGGSQPRIGLDEAEGEERADLPWGFDASPEDVLALDQALTKLEAEDEEGHRLVLLRYYAGLPLPEIARVLGSSLRTVERKWRFLRVWLQRELETT
jgi:RNA polymerase sigma factor (TIGR02999 family)